jgi:hypothetical protein
VSRESPPPVDDRFRMVLRVLVVAVAYLAGLLLAPDRVPARLLIWAGLVLIGWLLVDRATKWARERSGMMIAGTTILGVALAGLGLYLALR